MRKILVIIIAGMVMGMSACGYFLYPERVGQQHGRLDPAIIVLDAAALLFGILPGVVAFAVDITTGTIYLAPGQKSVIDKHRPHHSLTDEKTLRPADEQEVSIDRAKTARRLSAILGHPVDEEKIRYFKSKTPGTAVTMVRAEPADAAKQGDFRGMGR